ncbi:MAG: glutaredoxin 3, partial [Pseudomonadota bacterium]
YCRMAKGLLDKKGASYQEIDVMMAPAKRAEMTERSNGGKTVPQIFIGDVHIGGCDDLYAIERSGQLDTLLA